MTPPKILIPTLLFIGFVSMTALRPAAVPSEMSGLEMRLDTTKKKIDPTTGFVIDDGIDMVRAHCTGCHSSKLVTQYGASRAGWLDKIRWMQRTQNLWDLGEAEPVILDYLAKHYPAAEKFDRREPLKDVEWYRLGKGK